MDGFGANTRHVLSEQETKLTFWRFLCSGPSHPPTAPRIKGDSSPSESPEFHNPHEPLIIESPTIEYINLDNTSYTEGEDRILILTPLRDAAPYIDRYFRLLSELTYLHRSIDLAFLVGDSKDGTLGVLQDEVKRLQAPSSPFRFRSAMIIEKDFGDDLSQSVEERHSFKAQGTRRKGIGRARNYLLYAALRPEHRWVYWRDVDIVENPATVIEDLMKHDRDIIVPSERLMRLSIVLSLLTLLLDIWFHRTGKDGKEIEGRCKSSLAVSNTAGLSLTSR